ncbi:MAG: GAF domain-containing protein [Myxococcota bacterium]
MSTKRWRMVISDLGGDNVQGEVTVEAENWMSALRRAREELGEQGGVPTGSSCAVAPDGRVTVLDPIDRRRFVLSVDTTTSFKPASPKGVRVPSESAPQPNEPPSSPVIAKASPASQPAKPKKRAPAKTMAYIPADQIPTPPKKDEKKKKIKQTVAYISPGALKPPAGSNGAAAPQPTTAESATPAKAEPAKAEPAKVEPAKVEPAKPAPTAEPKTEAAKAEPAQPEPAQPEPAQPAKAVEPAQPEPAQPEPAQAEPATAPAQAATSDAREGSIDGVPWRLHGERDADPSDDNPLRYRERIFVVPAGTDSAAAEAVARDRLAAIQKSLAGSPPGQFINIAIFDHEWTGKPERPPIVTLQFKDWQSSTVVDRPLERVSARPPKPAPKERTTTDEHEARLADAFEACQDLLFLSSPLEALEFSTKIFEQLIPAEAVTASLYDIDADVFRIVIATGTGSESRQGQSVGSSQGLFGAASQLVSTALRVDDINADGRFDDNAEGRAGLDPRNALYLPLNHQGRLLGMIQLLNRSTKDAFLPADGDLAVYIGGQLSEFLHRARTRASQGN